MSEEECVSRPGRLSFLKRHKWWAAAGFLLTGGIVVALVLFILHLVLPRNFAGSGEKIPLEMSPPFEVLYYGKAEKPKGLVILGTGDGGWSYWEENTARHLMAEGYAVGGWDCRKFADTRSYDGAALSAGFRKAVEAIRKRSGAGADAPVWYGGWSTGAEQAVAAASLPDRPDELRGLLLAAPGERGRFGITKEDLLGMNPTGPGSFALAELAPALKDIRVAQFAAELDPLDDSAWLSSLTVPHRLIELPGKLHDMGGAGEEFQQKLSEAIAWTLQSQP